MERFLKKVLYTIPTSFFELSVLHIKTKSAFAVKMQQGDENGHRLNAHHTIKHDLISAYMHILTMPLHTDGTIYTCTVVTQNVTVRMHFIGELFVLLLLMLDYRFFPEYPFSISG